MTKISIKITDQDFIKLVSGKEVIRDQDGNVVIITLQEMGYSKLIELIANHAKI